MLGMMWLDSSTKLSAPDNARQAVAFFKQDEKYQGKRPLQVHVNKNEWSPEAPPVIDDLPVLPSRMVLPHHVWVVYEGVN